MTRRPEGEACEEALRAALLAAVPLRILTLQQLDAVTFARAFDRDRLDELAQTISEHGDDVLFLGRKKGESARVFNAVAEGIALLAFAPGGCTIFGETYEATRP